MNANQLRLGNWVQVMDDDNSYIQFQISSIVTNSIACEPIPLTPDILEKCGFVLNNLTENWELTENQNIIGIDKDDFSTFIGGTNSDYGFAGTLKSCVKSLHQLQNLYFALTGSELTLTL